MNQDESASLLEPRSPNSGMPAGMAAEPPGRLERLAADALRQRLGTLPVIIRLPNGSRLPLGDAPVATVTLKSTKTVFALARDPDMEFGERFMTGEIEVDGDLVALLQAVFRVSDARRGRDGRKASHSNPLRTSRDNVHHHYDLGNDFYRLWLDERLLYTCAYFPSPDTTLEDAQVAKMDLVCRKLRLRPGERVVEAGCGWGALALHMARHYGVSVKAYNLSHEQITFARARAVQEGLSDRVAFVNDDYREIREKADVFVSVGMLEHVGPADYPELGRVIARVLGKGEGRGLLHFIGRSWSRPLDRWISRRIFPGAYPPTLPEAFAGVFEGGDYAVLDVENLRLHYALTLDHWRRRYLASREIVRRMFDEQFERAWLLYLSGAQAGFLSGTTQLFQVVFAPAASRNLPWRRDGDAEEDWLAPNAAV